MNTEYLLRALLRDLVLPPLGPLLLVILGLLGLRRWRRYGFAVAWAGVALLWLASTPLTADLIMRAAESGPVLDLGRPVDAQAVVILSAGARRRAPEYGTDAPDQETLDRIFYGALIARKTALPVLVTGGGVGHSQPLGEIMKVFLERELATPVRWTENLARDTHENAVNSAAILAGEQVHRIVLVTHAEHMRRAAAEFRAAGLQVVPAPMGAEGRADLAFLDLIPTAMAMRRSRFALYELMGEVVRRLRAAF